MSLITRESANQSHNERLPHPCQDGYYQKTKYNKRRQECGENGTPAHCW